MKVFLEPQLGLSRAMDRVAAALVRYAPATVDVTSNRDDADLEVLHVIGYPETVEAIDRITNAGKRYAIIQYCLRSTQKPSTIDWLPLWRSSALVWSYYDLLAKVVEDSPDTLGDFPFYGSPLGVDSAFEQRRDAAFKLYTIFTSGYVAVSEGVSEASDAVRQVCGRQFHLGPSGVADDDVAVSRVGITDTEVAWAYARSKFVAGLRRCEGFEMPAAEGLICGARPVMFDAPHYRAWFDGFAEFIPEGNYEEVVKSLVDVFQRYKPVTDQERKEAKARFDWSSIVPNFWRGVLA